MGAFSCSYRKFQSANDLMTGLALLRKAQSWRQVRKHLVMLHQKSENIAELAELFSVSRPTVYRVLERARRTELVA